MFTQLLLEKVEVKNHKYINWYINLCHKAIARQGGHYTKNKKDELKAQYGYVEVHHILPRSFCDNPDYIGDKHNKIILTAKEHYIAHLLLAYSVKSYKMMLALRLMMNETHESRYTSNAYNKIRADVSKALSENAKEIAKNKVSHRKGVTLSKETRNKISNSLTNKKQSESTILKRANAIKEKFSDPNNIHGNTGRVHDEEYRQKMSEICKQVKKTDDWNNKNAMANTGRVHIANKMTKERKRPKRDVAEQMIKESNGEWIYCHCTAEIPD